MGDSGRVTQWALGKLKLPGVVHPHNLEMPTMNYSVDPDARHTGVVARIDGGVAAAPVHARITFADLPEDVFLHICFWLSVSDILSLRLVSRFFIEGCLIAKVTLQALSYSPTKLYRRIPKTRAFGWLCSVG